MTKIHLSAKQAARPYKKFWQHCLSVGRAHELLRWPVTAAVEKIKQEIDFKYMRYHGVFQDEMMVYFERQDKSIEYNFDYVDHVHDWLLDHGIRPFVEFGFMPLQLARGTDHNFWWKGYTTPPKDWNRWGDLVENFVRHCVKRYGNREVRQWYFEVWNEPETAFWKGTAEEYLQLYEVSVQAVQRVDRFLKVGGPAAAQFHTKTPPDYGFRNVPELLELCKKKDLPLDFISVHPYPHLTWMPMDPDSSLKILIPEVRNTAKHLDWLNELIKSSHFPDVEIHCTEWNTSPSPRDVLHDTLFQTSFIIESHLRTIGKTDSLSFWTITDHFEESRASPLPFHGGFGLLNNQGIPKPSYHAYTLLSYLGQKMVENKPEEGYCITRSQSGLQILLWNYVAPQEERISPATYQNPYLLFPETADKSFHLLIHDLPKKITLTSSRVSRQHGCAFDHWQKMGRATELSSKKIAELKEKAKPEKTIQKLSGSRFDKTFFLKPQEVLFLEISIK